MFEQRLKTTKKWEPVTKPEIEEMLKKEGYKEKAVRRIFNEMERGETYYLSTVALRAERRQDLFS